MNAQMYLSATPPIRAEFGENTDHATQWMNVFEDGDRYGSHLTLMGPDTPETLVTAIVGALPEPRRVALLRTLQADWYAASAKAEGLRDGSLGYIGSAGGQLEPPDPAPEDERFEATR